MIKRSLKGQIDTLRSKIIRLLEENKLSIKALVRSSVSKDHISAQTISSADSSSSILNLGTKESLVSDLQTKQSHIEGLGKLSRTA